MASGNIPPALKKQLEAADKSFARGDLRSAKMHADMAKALFSTAPEAQLAHAAYKVHIAAAKLNGGKPDHYAVLGVTAPLNGRPTRETHDAIKSQHKALCDLLDPAKSGGGGSAAAIGAAYKLVIEAFAALTDIKKNEAAAPAHAHAPRLRLPTLRPMQRPKMPTAAARRAPAVAEEDEMISVDEPAAAVTTDPLLGDPLPEQEKGQGAEAEEEEEDYYAGGRSRSGRLIPIVKY